MTTLTLQVIPPPARHSTRHYGEWPAVARQIGAHPVGTWVALSGFGELDLAPSTAGIVAACRREGFRVSVRVEPGRVLVLRGRPVAVRIACEPSDAQAPRLETALEPYGATPAQRTRIAAGEAEKVQQGGRWYLRATRQAAARAAGKS